MINTDSNIHIVMADDDAEDLDLLQSAIHSIDPEVELHLFNDGLSALQYLGNTQIPLPSLIVFDYNMPQKNGAQLLLTLNEDARYSKVPKVILSTSNAPLHIEECLKNGATDYLIKPFHLQECYELAGKLLQICRK